MCRELVMLAMITIGSMTALSGEASAKLARPGAGGNVQAHLDEQAIELRSQVAKLTGDLREQARRGGNYRRLYRESTEMFFLADHVHTLMHGPLDVPRLVEDVEELDRVFHRMEELAATLDGGFHNSGTSHGRHSQHGHGVSERLEEIEETLHHLRDDLAQLRRRDTREPAAPRPSPGISFGNGRFRINLND